MHPLLASQLKLLDPGSAQADPAAFSAAVGASYEAYDEQLRALRRQLAQAGKMASLGHIAAGIAHEINNPLAYVSANLEMLQESLTPLLALLQASAQQPCACPQAPAQAALRAALDLSLLCRDLPQLVQESCDGMQRVRQIVLDLKSYAHTGEQARQWEWADLHRGIDATLHMLRNELRERAEIVRDYGALPPVQCLPSQLNQVVMNLVVNASHALGPQRGRITLRTGAGDGDVWFAVSDSGSGIAPEHVPRLFDPSFTTKPIGQGTGLGLSLVQDIVRRHGGRIDVSTELGKGSTFRVVLPQRQTA
ncbi:sensor histidine kinase [Duganella violaceipulchra]|uniref:histidine kinase n=1 Tax=Duganella violaceipulchra TaxID=2849652 RepID=A0AA41HDT0_9BURK|nr:ATP-binding protein [Duganella violaceicalia]MBV6325499.1 ATPase [Duganella violaceicalia]MCP2012671.1 signal transduction histidine kinase [Duganella violaceicalia]